MKSQDLRNGMAIDMDGQVWMITTTDHVKPGKGPAYTQLKLKNVKSGSHVEKRLRSGEDVDQAMLDRRQMEYLYSDGSGAVFMDGETFDQMNIDQSVLGNAMDFLSPNSTITTLVYEGAVVNIELPATVELKITETPPGIKGATATNQLKEAICETGLKTRVPPFVESGQIIRVSTETGEYLGRA